MMMMMMMKLKCYSVNGTSNLRLRSLVMLSFLSQMILFLSFLLGKMKESGCSPNVCTYNTIIQGFLEHNDTISALKLLHEMVERGLSADAANIPMLMTFLSKEGIDQPVSQMLHKFISGEALNMGETLGHVLASCKDS